MPRHLWHSQCDSGAAVCTRLISAWAKVIQNLLSAEKNNKIASVLEIKVNSMSLNNEHNID